MILRFNALVPARLSVVAALRCVTDILINAGVVVVGATVFGAVRGVDIVGVGVVVVVVDDGIVACDATLPGTLLIGRLKAAIDNCRPKSALFLFATERIFTGQIRIGNNTIKIEIVGRGVRRGRRRIRVG